MNVENKEMTCICCPLGCSLQVTKTPDINASEQWQVSGNKCPRGKKYAVEEMTAPKRMVTSTVKLNGGLHQVISVKTSASIPKEKIFAVMDALSDIEVNAPIKVGSVIVASVAGTGVDIVATKDG